MKLRRSPVKIASEYPVEVIPSSEVVGGLWLLKTGSVEGNIAPLSEQEVEAADLDISLLTFKAAENLARQKSIEPEEAEKWFYAQETKEGTRVEARASVLSYLDPQDQKDYLRLGNLTRNLPLRTATRLFQYRVLFNVVVDRYDAKSDRLYIVEPWIDIDPVETKFIKLQSGLMIEITSGYENGSIGIKPTTVKIDKGEVGFICDEEGNYKIGFPDWDDDLTRQFLTIQSSNGIPNITRLYRFYLEEKGAIDPIKETSEDETVDETVNEQEDNSFLQEKKESNEQEKPLLSIGSNSTKESNHTESAILV